MSITAYLRICKGRISLLIFGDFDNGLSFDRSRKFREDFQCSCCNRMTISNFCNCFFDLVKFFCHCGTVACIKCIFSVYQRCKHNKCRRGQRVMSRRSFSATAVITSFVTIMILQFVLINIALLWVNFASFKCSV